MRILIVDDDRMICDGTAHRILNMRFEEIEAVECAYSAEEALETLQQRRFDAVFTDIRMGDMDGLELIEAIKAIQPNLICVVITAFDRFQYAQQAIRLGVEDFAVKPIGLESMRKHVRKVIDKYLHMAAQKETRLDLEICSQLSSTERDVHDCFALCGMQPPPGDVYMVVWGLQQQCPDLKEIQDIWTWRSRSQPMLLIYAADEKTVSRISRLAQRSRMYLGVSAPGRNVNTLSTQAFTALGYSWMYTIPDAMFWSSQNMRGISGLRSAVLAEVRALNSKGVRERLASFFSSMTAERRNMGCALIEAVAAELCETQNNLGMDVSAPFVPQENMGIDRVIAVLCQQVEEIKAATGNPDRLNPVAYAKHYAKEHLYESIDMAVLANHLNLSYAYFSRVFHEQAGMTFSKYLIELRMQEVCTLLKKGEKLVDIAERFGYQNAANLTRSFTREIGMSPSKWLETHNEE